MFTLRTLLGVVTVAAFVAYGLASPGDFSSAFVDLIAVGIIASAVTVVVSTSCPQRRARAGAFAAFGAFFMMETPAWSIIQFAFGEEDYIYEVTRVAHNALTLLIASFAAVVAGKLKQHSDS